MQPKSLKQQTVPFIRRAAYALGNGCADFQRLGTDALLAHVLQGGDGRDVLVDIVTLLNHPPKLQVTMDVAAGASTTAAEFQLTQLDLIHALLGAATCAVDLVRAARDLAGVTFSPKVPK